MDNSTCDVTDLGCWFDYLLAQWWGLVLSFWGWVLDGLVALVAYIPLPDFIENMGTYTLPSEVLYFTNLVNLDTGLAILATSWGLRFIIRRLPVVG